MAPFEAIFVWIAMGFYAIASALIIYSFVFKNEKVYRITFPLILIAFLFHTAGIFVRYDAVGNLPVAGDYETTLGGTWIIVFFTLYISLRHKTLRAVSVATLPFSLILLGFGVMRGPALTPMAASVRSFWLYIHVLFAQVAFGAFTIASGIGVLYLLKEKRAELDFYKKLSDLQRLDDLMFRFLIFGFITDAVMIASGSIWAKHLWGNYWSWDPVETWSLVTWIIYGMAVHLRLTMGWKGAKMAWLVIFALLGMIISFFGINLFVDTSLHMFNV